MIASKCGAHRVINDSTIEHRKSLITPNDSCNLYGDRGSSIKSLDDDSLTVESKITIACKKSLHVLRDHLTLAVNDSRLHYCREKVCSNLSMALPVDFHYILKFQEQSKLVKPCSNLSRPSHDSSEDGNHSLLRSG